MNIHRVKKLQSVLKNPLLIKKPENLLYLTGYSFMHGYLLVNPSRPSQREGVVFFGDGLERPPKVRTDFLSNIGAYVNSGRLELEDRFTLAEYDFIKSKLRQQENRAAIGYVRSPVDAQRVIKEPGEIALVKKSMQIVEQVFMQVKKKLRGGRTTSALTEIELAEFIKAAGLRLGAEDVSFPPIVAAGPHAAVPHHVPDKTRLRPNQSIILDFGFKYKNYCSDFTRTVFLRAAPRKLAEAYECTERAYRESIEFINRFSASSPGRGVEAAGVHRRAVAVLAEKRLNKYFIHSLGHGSGLEIHEAPGLSPASLDTLKDGMVFSIEPGVYLPKTGGIRIEDLVYLEGGRCRKFIEVPTLLKENIII
ncbi:MAG TPA: M24 family metallopeptidase [Patescibacteria group bacterium]|nr:M24 family metallopeptidase [Patescibacteria group bacterium]